MPWESFSGSESSRKRFSKKIGWSARVRCLIEYMVRSENAAEVGFVRMRRMNMGREGDGIGKLGPRRMVEMRLEGL